LLGQAHAVKLSTDPQQQQQQQQVPAVIEPEAVLLTLQTMLLLEGFVQQQRRQQQPDQAVGGPQQTAAAAANEAQMVLHDLERLLTRQLRLCSLLWQRTGAPTAHDAWPWDVLLNLRLIQVQQIKLTTGTADKQVVGGNVALFKEAGKGSRRLHCVLCLLGVLLL
jgi:hypothetical protein